MLKPIPSEVVATGRRRKKTGKKAQMPPKIQSKMTIELKDQKKLMKVVAQKLADYSENSGSSDEETKELIRGLQRSIILVEKRRFKMIQKKKRK